jgi:23S rRNA (guanine2445-N2)-methyltransferase
LDNTTLPTDHFEIIAKTLFGLEEVLASEIRKLGGSDIQILTRAVRFTGDQGLLYKSNYLLRTAIRILKPIASFRIFNDHQLYRHVKRIEWEKFMGLQDTFAIQAVTNSEIFRHSKYIALKSKDALVDRFREVHGSRPNVDTQDPDLMIHVHIDDKECTVSLDSSGSSLEKRGYKTDQTEAPMSEVLAAGIILLTEWDKQSSFIDPMCGSGTLPIEAAQIASGMPAGNLRSFAFEKWRDFDRALWKRIKEEVAARVQAPVCKIQGFDNDTRAVDIARSNATRASVDQYISFEHSDFLTSEPTIDGGVLILNPPYGERLEKKDEMDSFYGEIGTRLKHYYSGRAAWLLSSNYDALKHIGLRPSRKIKLFNGQLECSLRKYELYAGSKRRTG